MMQNGVPLERLKWHYPIVNSFGGRTNLLRVSCNFTRGMQHNPASPRNLRTIVSHIIQFNLSGLLCLTTTWKLNRGRYCFSDLWKCCTLLRSANFCMYCTIAHGGLWVGHPQQDTFPISIHTRVTLVAEVVKSALVWNKTTVFSIPFFGKLN